MQQLTPQERNKIIDEMINGLKEADPFVEGYSICALAYFALQRRQYSVQNKSYILELLSIPQLGTTYYHWWPKHELEPRILFLKSIKTCHK